ncbi:MAG TPA: right-handed parallel beta-helix repeat-containing protein [Vicinamibacterales bacterium]
MRISLLSIASSLALFSAQPASPATINVGPGGDLHAALVNARPGDTITLAPGAVYVGNFTLPAKDGTDFITIRPAGGDPVPAGQRMAPAYSSQLPKLQSPNTAPVIQTAPGAHHWRLVLLEMQGSSDGDLLALGDGSAAQNSLSQVPHDLVVDRCYIHGDPTTGMKRCVALNSAATTVEGSYISDCKRVGIDSQAIAGWNGPGPFTISNNYLEGSTENLLFGGSDPAIQGLVPSDITISNNLLSKPVAWRTQRWSVKNILELKNARRVQIENNVLQYNWLAGQSGFAVLFTVRNQNGHCPWCQVEQVVFEDNIVQHSAAGVSVLGFDDNFPSQQTQNLTIRNNLFADIDNANWGGNGYAFQIVGGPRQITIDHNTIIQEHAGGILQVEGPPILEFTYTNNLARHNSFGIIGRDHAFGNDTISAFFPGSRITNNVFADGVQSRYPAGNKFPSSADFRNQFVAYTSGDYRLVTASSWKKAATDGFDLGANIGIADSNRNPRDPGDGSRVRPVRLRPKGQ